MYISKTSSFPQKGQGINLHIQV